MAAIAARLVVGKDSTSRSCSSASRRKNLREGSYLAQLSFHCYWQPITVRGHGKAGTRNVLMASLPVPAAELLREAASSN